MRKKYNKIIIRSLTVSLCLVFCFSSQVSTFALSEEQKNLYRQGVKYYDIEQACDPTGETTADSPAGTSVLDGVELPATKGGVGLEAPVNASGNLLGSGGSVMSEKVTFSQHASKGQEYRDYYITMRWNYVKWNWDGTSADANNDEYNWFAEKPRLVQVTNPENNKSIVAAAIEAGPAPWTGVDGQPNNTPKQGWVNPQSGTPEEYKGRVSGLPPKAFEALGLTSSDQRFEGNGPDLLYSWAGDQDAKPGPTDAASLAETGGITPSGSNTINFPLVNSQDPDVDNNITSATASELSAQTKRGAQFARLVGQKNGIGGIRPDAPRFFQEHPSGNAIDILSSKMGTALQPGDEEFEFFNALAETYAKNHKELSVEVVIWNNKIISGSDGFQSWREYSGYGATSDPTLQHKDHIHVRFSRDQGSETIKLYGGLSTNGFQFADSSDSGALSCVCTEEGGEEVSAVNGENNEEKVWNYFIAKGLNAYQTAGIVGNMARESGFDPQNIQDPGGRTKDPSNIDAGWGLIQWTPGKKILGIAEEANITSPIHELSTQLDIVWWHMNNRSPTGVNNMLSNYNQTDAKDAAVYFEETMEGAGVPALDERRAAANAAYEKYKDNISDTTVVTTTDSSGNTCTSTSVGTPGENGYELEDMTFYDQCDPEWGGLPYGEGKSSICESGCGIVSFAMIYSTLTGNKLTPDTLANRYGDKYHTFGTDWSLWPVAARDYNLKMTDLGVDLDKARDIIKSGGLVLISVDPGEFTSAGHFMVIRKVDDSGNFYLADPNYGGNKSRGVDSNVEGYSADFLRGQGSLKKLWAWQKQ